MMYRPFRRATQIAVFLAMFIIPALNLFEIYSITGTFYSVNIGGLEIADPVVILQSVFASGRLSVPILGAALFPVFLALLFGRVWCGWMCPYHFMADGVAWVRSKFLRRSLNKFESNVDSRPGSFRANFIRFGVLLLGTVMAGAVGVPVLNYISAPGIISTEAMILVKEGTVSLELGFIVLILLLELLVLPRFWCRLVCPTGAFLSLFRFSSTLRVAAVPPSPKAACCKSRSCSEACPMGLAPFKEGDDLLCTNCGRCVDACKTGETGGRLEFIGFRSPVHGSERR